ncbi:MAG: hydroxyacylglutathione hydrolase [Gammaproteobacteria bacterium]|nr:hydroxyacylglutathione hydrolase [Gammaproteobacteria bacterium]
MFVVKPVPAFADNYIWLIINPRRHCAAVVDPGDAAPVLAALERERLVAVAILVTHHHGDHVGGVLDLVAARPAPVYGPAAETIPGRTHPLREGDMVELPDLEARFSVLEVPGHTAGHIAYYGHGMAFVGDTLFMSGCGRLFEGTADQMHASLGKLAQLPPTTRIYCAHEYTVANLRFAAAVEPDNADITDRLAYSIALREMDQPTVPAPLELEKRTNPFLRVNEPTVRDAASRQAGRTLARGAEVFGAVRRWKDTFSSTPQM